MIYAPLAKGRVRVSHAVGSGKFFQHERFFSFLETKASVYLFLSLRPWLFRSVCNILASVLRFLHQGGHYNESL